MADDINIDIRVTPSLHPKVVEEIDGWGEDVNRVLKKSPSRNSFLSAQPAGFGFGSIDAGELHA